MPAQFNPVNWFEIPATDLGRAKTFYRAVFGHTIENETVEGTKMALFPMELGAGGTGGSLVECEGYTPATTGTVVYFSAPDIEATLAKIESAGGMTLIPKTDIGQHGWFGHFQDTEGNRVGLHTPPTAS